MTTKIPSIAFRRHLAFALIGVIAGGAASSAAAADSSGVPSAHIRYRDLNLDSAAGLDILYKRIIIAAYQVCQPFGHDGNDNADPVAVEQCRDRIIAEAVGKIDKPALYAMYHARNSKRPDAAVLTAKRPR